MVGAGLLRARAQPAPGGAGWWWREHGGRLPRGRGGAAGAARASGRTRRRRSRPSPSACARWPLDGNVARVLARLFAGREPIDRPAVRERLRARGQALVPAAARGRLRPGGDGAGGAGVCAGRSPRCAGLPGGALVPGAPAGASPASCRCACPSGPSGWCGWPARRSMRRGRVLLVRRPPGTLAGGHLGAAGGGGAGPRDDPAAHAARGAAASWGWRWRRRGRGSWDRSGTCSPTGTSPPTCSGCGAGGGPRGRRGPLGAAARRDGELAISSFTRKTLALLASAQRPISAAPGWRRRRPGRPVGDRRGCGRRRSAPVPVTPSKGSLPRARTRSTRLRAPRATAAASKRKAS